MKKSAKPAKVVSVPCHTIAQLKAALDETLARLQSGDIDARTAGAIHANIREQRGLTTLALRLLSQPPEQRRALPFFK